MDFICDECGKAFRNRHYNKRSGRRFCSRLCYHTNRIGRTTATPESRRKLSEALKGRKLTPEHIEKVRIKLTGSKQPKISIAKLNNPPITAEWHIRSPRGVAYKFVNLQKFVRENKELFNTEEIPNLWERAAHGIHNLASISRGDAPNAPTHWRGWTLVSDVERHFVYGRDLLGRDS